MVQQNNNRKRNLPRIISKIAAVYLIVLAAFSWGYLSLKFKVFPHRLIVDVQNSIDSLDAQSALRANPRSAHEIADPQAGRGVTVNTLAEDGDDLIFTTLFRGGQFVADLMDREGRVLHSWTIPHGEVDMSKAADRAVFLLTRNQTIHGAHLSANGDVLLINEYRGMVKLNRDSELLWRTRDANHHALAVAPDGSIWSLSRHDLKDRKRWVGMANEPYFDDTVVHYSPDGQLLEEFSVAALIEDARYEGILYAGPPQAPRLADRDPLHINDIDVLSEAQAAHFPGAGAGDLMLSLRTVNTVIIVNPESKEIRWSMTGPFLRQHDPEITRDGLLLVYDNRTTEAQLGANARYRREGHKLGYSRLMAIDPASQRIVWEFTGSIERPFYSSIQGKHEELPNGNVLAVEPEGGRIFEVDRSSGAIVWEYINLLEPGYVGRVTQARRLSREELTFLGHRPNDAPSSDTGFN